MTTYEKIQMLCRREGFAISNLGEKVPGVKITRGAVSGWKKGAVPSAAVIKAVSEYFDVTPEYLTTEGAEAAFNTVNGNNNIIGNGNTVGNSLTEQEKALLDLFGKMDVVKQAQLLAFAADLVK